MKFSESKIGSSIDVLLSFESLHAWYEWLQWNRKCIAQFEALSHTWWIFHFGSQPFSCIPRAFAGKEKYKFIEWEQQWSVRNGVERFISLKYVRYQWAVYASATSAHRTRTDEAHSSENHSLYRKLTMKTYRTHLLLRRWMAPNGEKEIEGGYWQCDHVRVFISY